MKSGHRSTTYDTYNAVLNFVGQDAREATAIRDIVQFGFRVGTVRAALRDALERKIVDRTWDGNERFGRWIYFWADGNAS
jgi:hypothetical protein